MPVRDPLPLQLPKEVAEQAELAHGAHAAPDDAEEPAAPPEPERPAPRPAGRRRTDRRRR